MQKKALRDVQAAVLTDAYCDLRAWMQSSLATYKLELWRALFPIFAHVALELDVNERYH